MVLPRNVRSGLTRLRMAVAVAAATLVAIVPVDAGALASGMQRPLWTAGMEDGTTSEWRAGGGGGFYNSGRAEAVASDDVALTGTHSLRARIWTPFSSGVRAFRWAEPRAYQELYYSVWILLPEDMSITTDPRTGGYLNLMQFKSRDTGGSRVDPVWGLFAAPDGAGGLYLRAGWGWGYTPLAGPYPHDGVGGKWYEPSTQITLPVGRWIHLEAFLRQSNGFDGSLVVWQDEAKILDLSGVRTSYRNCNFNDWCADNEWSVNLYSDGLTPNPASIYIDDAAIATTYVF